jgi:hypothetical protein
MLMTPIASKPQYPTPPPPTSNAPWFFNYYTDYELALAPCTAYLTMNLAGPGAADFSPSCSCSGLPAGCTFSTIAATVETDQLYVLSITNGCLAGVYACILTATDGAYTATCPFTLVITNGPLATPPPPSDSGLFFLSANTNSLQFYPGSSLTVAVTLGNYGPGSATATLSTPNLPAGITVAFASPTITGTVLATVSTAGTILNGYSNLTIAATSGSDSANVSIQVLIQSAKNPAQPLATAPGSISFGLTLNCQMLIPNTYISSVIAPSSTHVPFPGYTLSSSGVPAGVTLTFGPEDTNYITPFTLAAGGSPTPGAYIVSITAYSDGDTATCYFSLLIRSAQDPNDDLAPQSGIAPWMLATTPIAMKLSDQLAVAVYPSRYGELNLGGTPSVTGLPDLCFFTFNQGPAEATYYLYLLTTPTTAPGIYSIALVYNSSLPTTTFPTVLTIADTDASPNLVGKRKLTGRNYGLVYTAPAQRQTVRRMAIGINPNSTFQSRWRHIFATAKRNYLAIQPGGAASAPTGGVDPVSAWTAQAATYVASRYTPPPIGSVRQSAIPGPLATTDAYWQMVQTTMASLSLPPLPAPALTTLAITSVTGPAPDTSGGYTVTSVWAAGFNTGSTPFPKVAIWPCGPLVYAIGIVPAVESETGATYSCTTSDPALTASIALEPEYFPALLSLSVDPAASPASYTAVLTILIGAVTLTQTFALSTSTAALQPVAPSPTFPPLTSLNVNTAYDHLYNVIGFILTVTDAADVLVFMIANGAAVAPWWKLTASAQNKSSYSAPSSSSWAPINYSQYDSADPATVLALWEDTYGDLPASGHIYFQMTPLDPVSGCVGAPVSNYATWKVGTLKGFLRDAWLGPIWTIHNTIASVTSHQGETSTFTFYVQGFPSQAGWDGGTGVPYSGSITFTGSAPKGTSPVIPLSFAPSPVAIPSGDTSYIPVVCTVAVPSDFPLSTVTYTISGTDQISSDSFSVVMIVVT